MKGPMQTNPPSKTVGSRSKRYDENFREQVLEHWRSSGKSAGEVAAAFGISTFSLYAWRRRHEALPVGGAGNAARPTVDGLTKENAALRRELAHVQEQRDILKKTLAIFSEGPRMVTNGLTK